ncbi:MAG TPA: hypothetical protein VET26_06545 [Candidatus Sulfotelmatobacter sp.]|nr:hypothetical protein [Candidatus Sulfotelmatobacter sp.]
MAAALIAGPALALIGVVAVFFVLRRKSVEKRSMYSARRSQFEHKVRAARQRTLAPHGRADKAAQAPETPPASPFAEMGSAPATYEPAAYQAPPIAPPPPPMTPLPPPPSAPEAAPAPQSPWEVGPTAPSPYATPSGEPPPFMPPTPEAPAPGFEPAPVEAAWNPAPLEPSAPAQYETSAPVVEPPRQDEPAQPVSAPSGGASWSIVGDNKDMSISSEPEPKQKGKKKSAATGSWQLASGDVPGDESEEVAKRPSATVAIAQYAVLVVGLVMVLIGVLIMIGSHPG